MKRLSTVILAASLALVCTSACAGHRHGGYEKARVVRANPVYETVRYPVNEPVCWVAFPVNRTRCELQRSWRTEQHIVGWDVDYRYRGRIFNTFLPERPGKHIRVPVNTWSAAYYPGR